MPVTILYPHSSDELYGSDLVLLNLVRRLDRGRFRPYVLLPTDIPYEGKLSRALGEAGVAHEALAMPVLRRRYFTPRGLPRFLGHLWRGTRGVESIARREGGALIHSNTSAVWGGALAASRLHLPHLWHVHEVVTHPTFVRKLIAWMVARHSVHVVAISRAVADHLLADAPELEGRLSVIYDAVDTDQFSPMVDGSSLRRAWGVAEEDVLVGVVGRISAWKGQDFFLRAFARAAREHPRVKAVIAGDVVPGEDWRREALQRLSRDLGVANRVLWPGYHENAAELMAALDILALPSTRPEPFGMVVIEAMAAGKPVIATAHGGPLESVVDGETGLLVPPDDPAGMAMALVTLAGNSALCREMGARGRARTEAMFGFQPHVRAFQELYERLLREKIDPGS
ncbi:MAG TPA: glycosyltransferase family 4 protein [Caldilineae bacterium]|nr:glycosyltransferase family 4 protein [Caldilineae bacterium]